MQKLLFIVITMRTLGITWLMSEIALEFILSEYKILKNMKIQLLFMRKLCFELEMERISTVHYLPLRHWGFISHLCFSDQLYMDLFSGELKILTSFT